MTVSELGEDKLIARLAGKLHAASDVKVGIGDDCAVVDWDHSEATVQLLKTDCLVEGVHYLPGTDPIKVGWKAMARVISDIAAMAGEPKHALVTLAVDADRSVEEIEGWYVGMQKVADAFGFSIVGGETTLLPHEGALLAIAMTGQVGREAYFTRGRARPGDLIAVTGSLGDSFATEHHLDFRPRLPEAQWLARLPERSRPTAMMDLSDGLSKDLLRLADRSDELGYRVDMDHLPRRNGCGIESAVGDGEDYELLMTLPNDELLKDWAQTFADVPLTIIGEMLPTGADRTALTGGWDHFTDK